MNLYRHFVGSACNVLFSDLDPRAAMQRKVRGDGLNIQSKTVQTYRRSRAEASIEAAPCWPTFERKDHQAMLHL